ncbi:MAG: hypothetical protein ACTSVI_02550 [Promethearchaeota archaeon]
MENETLKEEEKILKFLRLENNVEDLYMLNLYYILQTLGNKKWRIDWKTFTLIFVLIQKNSIADIIKKWEYFRHYKDISPRLEPLHSLRIIKEEPGPKNSKILEITPKGKYVAAFLFYLFLEDNLEFNSFDFLKPILNVKDASSFTNFFEHLKVLKSQVPALIEFIPKIQKTFVEMNWKLDSKLLLIPLYLLDNENQSYTDLIQNYPQFGYYRELKQRIKPLITLKLIKEEKSGKKGAQLSITQKGRRFLAFFAYLLDLPNIPSS